jgi:hypothetical protein
VHSTDPWLNGIYGAIWFDELGDAEGQVHRCNVAVFAYGRGRPLPVRVKHMRPARGAYRRLADVLDMAQPGKRVVDRRA